MKKSLKYAAFFAVMVVLSSSRGQNGTKQQADGYNLIVQKGGATLGYSPSSGITILYRDGYAFKDLNRNGKLDPYEDWRKPAEDRASDLAARMSIEEIAGLMLYSSHEAVPASV